MKSLSTEKVRHLIVRAEQGERFPEALATELRDQAVTCGWMRGSGVLTDVTLRTYAAEGNGAGALGDKRRLEGPVHVLSLEGSIGLESGDVSFGMRVTLARETDAGIQTLAGELVSAQVVGFELVVAAFDEHAVPRALDRAAQVALLFESAAKPEAVRAAQWGSAIAASPPAAPERAKPAAASSGAAGGSSMSAPMPQRPAKQQDNEPDTIVPEAGDMVEHFAFGICEVMKSEGDRLYLRMQKDQRIKEIALEMLKVTKIGDVDGKPTYRLARRL